VMGWWGGELVKCGVYIVGRWTYSKNKKINKNQFKFHNTK